MATTSDTRKTRQRVPASERRDALIDAAIHEFAAGGFHGTPVDRVARRVGVAQPYVFSLFGSKRDLFLAAIDRCYERVGSLFQRAADAADIGQPDAVKQAMGDAYTRMLEDDRDILMLQLQSYAACDDEVIRERVRTNYAALVKLVERLMPEGTEQELIDEFFRYGMWLNVTAAMGVADLSVGCEWIRSEPSAD